MKGKIQLPEGSRFLKNKKIKGGVKNTVVTSLSRFWDGIIYYLLC